MSARILTHDEVVATPDVGESWHAEFVSGFCGVMRPDGSGVTLVDGDACDQDVDVRNAALMAAAPDLRATALDAMDRADAAERMAAMSSEAAVSSAREFALIIAAQTARADAAEAEAEQLRRALFAAQHLAAEGQRARVAQSLQLADALHLAGEAMRVGLETCDELRQYTVQLRASCRSAVADGDRWAGEWRRSRDVIAQLRGALYEQHAAARADLAAMTDAAREYERRATENGYLLACAMADGLAECERLRAVVAAAANEVSCPPDLAASQPGLLAAHVDEVCRSLSREKSIAHDMATELIIAEHVRDRLIAQIAAALGCDSHVRTVDQLRVCAASTRTELDGVTR